VDSIRERVELEVFLPNNVTQGRVDTLREKIQAIPGISRITYISKEEAARIFRQEFGENITDVLDFNPLPPSFKVTMKEGYRTSDKVQEINNTLTQLDGVESVRYRKALLELIDRRAHLFTLISIGLGAIIGLSSIFLVQNTIRLAIYAKRNMIHTMKLVGATRGFIRRPFIIEGILHGLIGGGLAAGFIYLLVEIAITEISPDVLSLISVEPYVYAAIVAAGCILGFFGSLVSIRRFIGDTVNA
jgi:cell division transport system permease protein